MVSPDEKSEEFLYVFFLTAGFLLTALRTAAYLSAYDDQRVNTAGSRTCDQQK